MKNLFLIAVLFAPLAIAAQAIEPLIFREKLFDFGDILEAKGPVNHEFVFTNNSGRPVKILSVNASCGCTTPGWSKAAVAPGKTGFVKVSFDPKGRPGFFNKSLTVITDLDANPLILQVKGQVVRPLISAEEFTTAIGSLRMKSKSFNMGTVYINTEAVKKEFPVLNGGTQPLRFIKVERPDYVHLEMPAVLDPGESGSIKVIYDGRMKNSFGFASDNILITTNDPGEEAKSISLYATLEEFYPPLAPAELKVAPQAVLKEQSVDLGQSVPGATLERKVTLVNRGKKELKIKALHGNCPCITAEASKLSIKGGDSTSIKVIFKPQNRGGTQQKAITIYSNDPRNPVQLLSVLVYLPG